MTDAVVETVVVTDPTDDIDSLPEWARNSLKKANGEAATYRKQLRDAQDALGKAKTPEDIEAAVAEVKSQFEKASIESAREIAKLKHGLPEESMNFLSGTTAEEIDANAKALAALVGQVAAAAPKEEKLRGGLNPALAQETSGKFDPAALARDVEKNANRLF